MWTYPQFAKNVITKVKTKFLNECKRIFKSLINVVFEKELRENMLLDIKISVSLDWVIFIIILIYFLKKLRYFLYFTKTAITVTRKLFSFFIEFSRNLLFTFSHSYYLYSPAIHLLFTSSYLAYVPIAPLKMFLSMLAATC